MDWLIKGLKVFSKQAMHVVKKRSEDEIGSYELRIAPPMLKQLETSTILCCLQSLQEKAAHPLAHVFVGHPSLA